MKLKISLLMLLVLVSLGFSAQVNPIQDAINAFAKQPGLKPASITFMAYDLTENKLLAAYDPDRVLIPASTTKLWSTAGALEILSPSFAPKTEVYCTGKLSEEGILHGDILIKGFGDATAGSQYFGKRASMRNFFDEWVRNVLAKGIKVISGDVIADASSLGYFGVPEGWTWSDMGNYYGAFASGLTIYDNLLELYFNTSSQKNGGTTITKTNPVIPGFDIKNHVKSDAIQSDNAYVFSAPYSSTAFVTGTLPLNRQNFIVKAAIQNPEELFALEFLQALRRSGVQVLGNSFGFKTLLDSRNFDKIEHLEAKKTLLFTHYGHGLTEVIKVINLESVNLFAEHLIHWIALERDGGMGYHKRGMEILNDHWKSKFDIESARITDGSGLSRSNSISARHFIELLKYMKDNVHFENSLAVAGQTGTLKNLCNGLACLGKIKAKSGTINGVKAYAGYAYPHNGNKIAFAFIVNNHRCTSSEIKTMMEQVLNSIFIPYNQKN
jgi:D-alanyl-D-alanine carboxypeptidase/D-alanyl-D-alanine-endopeptidase (penicillin-binding protein 4)